MANARKVLKDVQYGKDALAVARDSHCLMILTEWDEFKTLDYKKLLAVMKQPLLFDGRNLLDQDRMRALGFEYYGVGRGLGQKTVG